MGAAKSVFDRGAQDEGTSSVVGLLVRLVLLALIDVFAVWFIINLVSFNNYVLAAVVGLLTIISNIVIFRNEFFPIRWMLVGLILMALFAVYPILFTVNVSFTNFGFGHLLTKEQAIEQLENIKYLPEGAGAYSWTAYVSEDGEFALWLQDENGRGLLALPGVGAIEVSSGEEGVGEFDDAGIPLTVEGYERLKRTDLLRYIGQLGDLRLGDEDDPRPVQVTGLDAAAELEPRYIYDEESDTITDQVTGTIYNPVDGFFTADDGEQLTPGYRIYVGLDNYTDFFKSPALRGPLVRIIIWNFVFAFLSVTTTFFLGLGIALIFNDKSLPGRKVILTLLLIPYTIPSLITILVWRGLLNPELGLINRILTDLFGWAPAWFTDPWWAKVGILLINLWLGYPYFMLICSGALQAIPTDIYGAAEVDGANMWQRFWRITFPLLLVAVGPLLVASFIFNFNNFNVIYLFNLGGPAIPGAATQAGHTDILISYVYKLAFAGGRGAQYGFAAAITMIIFIVVAILTLLQFRYTQMWEEVGENV
ncbi:MAG TPA: ABC transporter permease subunit [Patescibacteria group bacterium]|nr:ABC transporter permease subunit [Patescibacteria group bacterium]